MPPRTLRTPHSALPTLQGMKFPSRLPIPEEVLRIAKKLEDAGYETWCVGGAIRDNLLGLENHDFDLTTAAPPDEVRRVFPHTVPVGIEHGTVAVLDRHHRPHEVTTFRRDIKTDGRHAVVEFGVSLMDDLARRDFTINAMAYHPLKHEWRDPFKGADDLGKKLIRSVGDANWRFQEDYLRILRALRFSARFEFRIHPRTLEAAKANVQGLAQLSAERVRDEWFKGIATAARVSKLLALWIDTGAARIWLPEIRKTGNGKRETWISCRAIPCSSRQLSLRIRRPCSRGSSAPTRTSSEGARSARGRTHMRTRSTFRRSGAGFRRPGNTPTTCSRYCPRWTFPVSRFPFPASRPSSHRSAPRRIR